MADAVTTAHVGDVAVVEDGRFQKLILIVLTMSVEDVAAEDKVHRMALALEEEHIDSYFVLQCPYFVYLNYDHNTALQ